MKLQTFRSLWTNGFDLDAALRDCRRGGAFDGVEGPMPLDRGQRRDFVRKVRDAGIPFIAEVATGGGYVPNTRTLATHFADFQRQAEAALEAEPLLLTVLGGCDAWPIALCLNFLERAISFASDLGVDVAFETHRSRATFSPWRTEELLVRVPAMRLTCDFSHWCCVCERLVLDEDPGILRLCAERTRHVHGRVGYAQGPQAPHPAAPAFRESLLAHERWWRTLWEARDRAGDAVFTITPEFGPDGYLQANPFTGEPVASLDEINTWMAQRLRSNFAARSVSAAA